MNAERLHIVAKAIQEELVSRRQAERIQQLTTNLQNLVNQPGNQGFQQAVATALAELQTSLNEAPSNFWSPAWRQVLIEIGGDTMLGSSLADRIGLVVERNEQLTPQAAHQAMLQIQQSITTFKSAIDQLVGGFQNLKIGSEDLSPGESEFGISIPRVAIDDDLFEFTKELQDFRFILRTFAELTGSPLSFPIRTISSSDLLVYVALASSTAAALAKATAWLIDQYKKIVDIRVQLAALRNDGVPEENLKGIEGFANSNMEDSIEKIAVEIETEYSVVQDGNRQNEMHTSVKVSLNKIANRIDQGFNFDVRIQPPTPGTATDGEAQKAVETIRAASPSLQFVRLGGDPILGLPEPDTEELTAEQKPKRPRARRKNQD